MTHHTFLDREREREAKKAKEAVEANEALLKNIKLHKDSPKKETPEEEGIRLAEETKELMSKQQEKKEVFKNVDDVGEEEECEECEEEKEDKPKKSKKRSKKK
jgi:hypothetical protein